LNQKSRRDETRDTIVDLVSFSHDSHWPLLQPQLDLESAKTKNVDVKHPPAITSQFASKRAGDYPTAASQIQVYFANPRASDKTKNANDLSSQAPSRARPRDNVLPLPLGHLIFEAFVQVSLACGL
jgi:hypothetical protein